MFNQGQQNQLAQNQLGANIFNQGQQNQLAQNQFAGSMFNQGQQTQLGANQLGASINNQNLDRQLSASQGLMGYGLQGAQQAQQAAMANARLGQAGSQFNANMDMRRLGMMLDAGGLQRGITNQQNNAGWGQQQLYDQAIGGPIMSSQSSQNSQNSQSGNSSGGIIPGLFGAAASVMGGGG